METDDGFVGFARRRRDLVLKELQSRGAVKVTEMAVSLGVSPMTIRRDINHLVERGLAERVYGGAVVPGAYEDHTLRSTAREHRRVIGMVVPSAHYYWPSIVAGAREAAAASDIHLVVRSSTYDVEDYFRHTQAIAKMPGVAGLIVAPNMESTLTPGFLSRLAQFRVPAILADREPRSRELGYNLEWVSSDHARGARLAVRYLHRLGHRRIGLLVISRAPSTVHIMRGWREELEHLGLPSDESLIGITPEGRELMSDTLQRCIREKLTALIVQSDPSAVALVQYLIEHDIDVPGQLSVISYDDEVAALSEPALSAVRPPKGFVGRLAVEMVLSRIREGDRRPLHNALISPQLLIRQTSGEPVRPLS